MSSTRVWTGQRKESINFKYTNKNYSVWEEIQMAEQKQCSSWPPTTTSKIHLHVEYFSPKVNWNWEKLLFSQGYREKHTKSGLKGGEEGRSGSTSLGGRRRERGVTQAQRPSLGNEQLKPRVGHSKPGASPGRASSLSTFENQLQTGSRAEKNLHSARKGCSHAYFIMEQGRPSMLKLPGTLTGIP